MQVHVTGYLKAREIFSYLLQQEIWRGVCSVLAFTTSIIVSVILPAFSSWLQYGFSSSKHHILTWQHPRKKDEDGLKGWKEHSYHTCPVTLEENPSKRCPG